MDIEGIKNWLDKAIDLFENNPADTIPLRISENRKLLGAPFRKREEIKAWVQANKPAALPHLVELKQWMEDWYHYFDTGYRPVSGETIDTLPNKILAKLKWIREKIENL